MDNRKAVFTGTDGQSLAGRPRICREFAARGVAVLRFDFTGPGQSDGDFANTTFHVQRRRPRLRRQPPAPPSVLIGHSLGGAAVLAAAHRVPEVRSVVTIGAPADTAHLEHLIGSSTTEIEIHGVAEVLLAGLPFRISNDFLADIKQQNQTAASRASTAHCWSCTRRRTTWSASTTPG